MQYDIETESQGNGRKRGRKPEENQLWFTGDTLSSQRMTRLTVAFTTRTTMSSMDANNTIIFERDSSSLLRELSLQYWRYAIVLAAVACCADTPDTEAMASTSVLPCSEVTGFDSVSCTRLSIST